MASGGDLLQAGATVGDHVLVRTLGHGAMGAVFEAVHRLIGKRVAIKVLTSSEEGEAVAAKRLLEEARAVNAINHPGVVDIFDAGLLPDGRPYLVMELLSGRTLQQELKLAKGGLPLRLVFHVLAQVLDALGAAHRAGVIHRDLKPSNVFLVDQPTGLPLVKLVDFGIARREGRAEALTMPRTTVGSMGFMAPEHLAGNPVPGSDLYSCGCLAWLMLTGRPVFGPGNLETLVAQHLREVPGPVSALRPEVGRALTAFVSWLLEKDVGARPSSAEVALTVLREAERTDDQATTVPGAPDFLALARQADARARQGAESSGGGADGRPARVLTAHRRVERPHADGASVPPRSATAPAVTPALVEDVVDDTVVDSSHRRR